MFAPECGARLRESFRRLSQPMQVALTLRLRDGFTPSKVGRALGLSSREAATLLGAALEAWRAQYGGTFPESIAQEV